MYFPPKFNFYSIKNVLHYDNKNNTILCWMVFKLRTRKNVEQSQLLFLSRFFNCTFISDSSLELQCLLSHSGFMKRGRSWVLIPKLHTIGSVGTLRKNVNSRHTGK